MDAPTVTLTFAVRPDPVAESTPDAPRRFRGVAYSGGVVPAFGWNGDAAIDLTDIRLPDQVFALVNHDVNQIAGKGRLTVAGEGEGRHLAVEGELFTSTPAGQQVSALFAEGAPWQMSVGIQASSESAEKPREVDINGRRLRVHTVFRAATVREVSFVPVGADPATHATAFARTGAKPPMSDQTLEDLRAEVQALTAARDEALAARDAGAARILELESQVSAITTERDSARRELRATSVRQLFSDLGREWSDDAAAVYFALPEDTYTALAADLRASRPQLPEHLFREQAVSGGPTPAPRELTAAQYDQLLLAWEQAETAAGRTPNLAIGTAQIKAGWRPRAA